MRKKRRRKRKERADMELDMVASMEVDKVADKHIAISVTGEFDPEPFDIHIDKSFHFKKSTDVLKRYRVFTVFQWG